MTAEPTTSTAEQPWLTRGVAGIGGASLLSDLGHEVPTSLLPSFLTSTLGAQRRIGEALTHIEQRLAETARQEERHDSQLNAALALVTDIQVTYEEAPDPVRRKLNQVMFKKIIVEEDGELSSVLAEPFDLLRSPHVRELVGSTGSGAGSPRHAQQGPAPTTKAPTGWWAPRLLGNLDFALV